MGIYQIRFRQELPLPLNEAWKFFSSPHNLKEITPAHMKFKILNGVKPNEKMYAGQIIAYSIRIFPFYTCQWVTEITHVEEGKSFIDEQRFGPYQFWHHEHRFAEHLNGLIMEDILHYKIPMGLLGRLMHALFIKKKIEAIFTYRKAKLEQLFGLIHS